VPSTPARAAAAGLRRLCADNEVETRCEAAAALVLVQGASIKEDDLTLALDTLFGSATASTEVRNYYSSYTQTGPAWPVQRIARMGKIAASAAARLTPLLADGNALLRAYAGEALWAIGQPSDDALKAVLDGVIAADERTQQHSVAILGRIAAPVTTLVPAAIDAMAQRYAHTRIAAAEAVVAIATRGDAGPLIPAIPAIGEMALDENAEVAAAGWRALRRLAPAAIVAAGRLLEIGAPDERRTLANNLAPLTRNTADVACRPGDETLREQLQVLADRVVELAG
jgi:hypothetical protein